jgi:hypothetical protein
MEKKMSKNPEEIIRDLKFFLAEEIEYNLNKAFREKDNGNNPGYEKFFDKSLCYSSVMRRICDTEEAKELRSAAFKQLKDSGAI